MNELALFAGAGGGILGGKLLGWRTVCAVEINAYCARRLMQRQNEGHIAPFPFGTMYVPSTDHHGADVLMWFLAGFPVKEYPRSVTEQGLPTKKAHCGENKPESLAKYDHVSHSWKTHQSCFLTEDYESLQTLPEWGMVANGELWQHRTPELTTKGEDYGSLPTPRCSRGFTNPTLGKVRNDCLTTVLLGKPILGMRPHPDFVEWMMGWPIGWTAATPLETDKFQQWLNSHGKLSNHD